MCQLAQSSSPTQLTSPAARRFFITGQVSLIKLCAELVPLVVAEPDLIIPKAEAPYPSSALRDVSFPLVEYVLGMTNRFGVLLRPEDVRWAAAEHVSETVIAAVLLLHERSVDDIAPQLTATELQQVIVLHQPILGRCSRARAPRLPRWS